MCYLVQTKITCFLKLCNNCRGPNGEVLISCVQISPEAAHFSWKKGMWVVSGVVVLCCLPSALFNYLSNLF